MNWNRLPASGRHLRPALAITLLGATLLAGCGGDGGGGASGPDGVFIDAPVQGLGYRTTGWSPRSEAGFRSDLAISSDGSRMAALAWSPVASGGGLEVSTDQGQTWRSVLAPSPPAFDFGGPSGFRPSMAMSADGQVIVVVPVGNGGKLLPQNGVLLPLQYSSDGGESWVTRQVPIAGCIVTAAAVSGNGQRIFLAGSNRSCNLRSEDAGLTWTGMADPRVKARSGSASLASSLDGSHLVYVDARVGAWKSADAGVSWQALDADAGPLNRISDADISADGSVIVLAPSLGLQIHTAAGRSDVMKDTTFESVAGSDDMKRLVAAVRGGRLYRSSDSGQSWVVSESKRTWETVAISGNGQHALAAGGGLETDFSTFPSLNVIERPLSIFVAANANSPLRFTDANGGYRCNAGEQITFYLGNFSLGTSECAEAVHVYQLAGLGDTAERGLRIAQLLQSLNTSGDPANIVLPDLSAQSIDINLGGTDEEFATAANTLLSSIASATNSSFTLVSKADAQAHVESEIIKLPTSQRQKICSLNPCNNDLLTQLAAGLQGTVGGSVTGLPEGARLNLSLAFIDPDGVQRQNTLSITLDRGSPDFWTFLSPLPTGSTYTVAMGDISPQFVCIVSNASGTMSTSNISNVAVSCSMRDPLDIRLAGDVSGLQPSQSITLSNGDDSVVVDANGQFAFPTVLAAGAEYDVSISGLTPFNLACEVIGAQGVAPVSFDSDVITPLQVTCDGFASYTLGGTVSGLPAGESITLRNDEIGGITAFELLSANGSYSFAESFTGGFMLSITSVPSGLQCQLSRESGAPEIPSATVDVTCQGARVTGIVNGLVDGATVQLSIVNSSTGAQQIDLTGTGAGLAFNSIYMPEGATFDVTVIGTSAGTTCGAVTNGSGTIGTTNITNLSLDCSFDGGGGTDPLPGTLGGTVTGLEDFDSVMIEDLDNFEFIDFLFNDSGQGGSFTMPSTLAPGTSYDITAQYTGLFGLTCTVTNGTGVMPAADATPNFVDNILVTCQ